MIPLGWIIAGGLALALVTGGAGYFAGKDVQRDADDSRALRTEVEARATSLGDERVISSLTDTIDRVASAALNRAEIPEGCRPRFRVVGWLPLLVHQDREGALAKLLGIDAYPLHRDVRAKHQPFPERNRRVHTVPPYRRPDDLGVRFSLCYCTARES